MTAPGAAPLVDARIHIERASASFVIDVKLTLHAGEVVAVMGPNGAGKSTLIRALAGLEPSAPVALPGITRAVLLQQRALFPGLDVADNVGFPLVTRGLSRVKARQRALALLDTAGLRAFAERRVESLSGGEAQRVALERTLAAVPLLDSAPHLLLLDEPFTALDVEHNAAMRARLRMHLATLAQRNSAAVLVTHRLDDALAFATRVLVLERGSIAQDASPRAIVNAPATPFVQQLVADAKASANAVHHLEQATAQGEQERG